MKLGRTEEAIADLELAEKKDTIGTIAGIADGLGQCKHKIRKYEYALDSFKECIELEPDNIEFRIHRAECYFDMGLYDDSIADLQHALAQN